MMIGTNHDEWKLYTVSDSKRRNLDEATLRDYLTRTFAGEDGDVVVLQAGREEKLLAEMNMRSSVYSTPVPANGALFIATRNRLFALEKSK